MDAKELLTNPLVLRSAWYRVKRWYLATELKPEPEFSHWQLNWQDELKSLGEDLANNSYRPKPFPLVPYPKKGAITRHYTLPSVRDQVAFAVFANLLAPICELQMPKISFGNRWYRGVTKRKSSDGSLGFQWKKGSFSLSKNEFYEPYRRGHSLFRRVAHWTATAMTNSLEQPPANDSRVTIEDYPAESLPAFIKRPWWQIYKQQPLRGYWIQGDLQLAYPSARVNELSTRLLELASIDFTKSDVLSIDETRLYRRPDLLIAEEALKAFPSDVSFELIFNIPLRKELAKMLGKFLLQVEYTNENDSWCPKHATCSLPVKGSTHKGIPTGLAISGFLMNVYLTKLDQEMCNYIEENRKNSSGQLVAYLRFADDFVILATSTEMLAKSIDKFWTFLAGDPLSLLLSPSSRNETNLRINWSKVKPDSWSAVLDKYLEQHGWERCPDCKILKEPLSSLARLGVKGQFHYWFKREFKNDTEVGQFEQHLEMEALTPQKLGPFVTHLVERLSQMGNDNVLRRFGKDCSERLQDLHSLVRTAQDDGQIRDDTRLSFVINKMSDCWLPDESTEAASYQIGEIRRSAAACVLAAPFKFQMWRAVLRCATRRPPELSTNGEAWKDQQASAEKWLKEMLILISTDLEHNSGWLKLWPEKSDNLECRKSSDWKMGYLSFLRASFWDSYTDVIADLKAMALEIKNLESSESSTNRWNSSSWIYRILSEKQIVPVIKWLSNISKWANVLYGETVAPAELEEFEITSLKKAILASQSANTVFKWLRQSSYHSFSYNSGETGPLLIPRPLQRKYAGAIQKIMKVDDAYLSSPDLKPCSSWILLYLTRDLNVKYKAIGKAITAEASLNFDQKLRLASRFHGQSMLISSIRRYMSTNEPDWQSGRSFDLQLDRTTTAERLESLYQYANYREFCLSIAINPKSTTDSRNLDIHSLLWGPAWSKQNVREWRPAPWEVPELGLPVPIGLKMFNDVLNATNNANLNAKSSFPHPPTWAVSGGALESLAEGRKKQFRPFNSLELQEQNPVLFEDRIVDEAVELKCWSLHPHPIYYLPWALGMANEPSEKYRIWCHFLTLLTVLEGSERVLNSFWQAGGPGVIPFDERWDMRNRMHLPTELWKILTELQLWFSSDRDWSDSSLTTLDNNYSSKGITPKRLESLIGEQLNSSMEPKHLASLTDFSWQRVDISLDATEDLEVLRTVCEWQHVSDQPALISTDLLDKLTVRLAQTSAAPDWRPMDPEPSSYFKRFPQMLRSEKNRIMSQVYASFRPNNSDTKSEVIVFPELVLPESEISSVVALAQQTNQAALIGLHLRYLNTGLGRPPMFFAATRFVVNQALLVVPVTWKSSSLRLPPRRFLIDKPNPSHMEWGFVDALNIYRNNRRVKYRLQAGRTWYRFLHPTWGDFSVAICADIIDARPWASMRSELLHIFMSACNPDVDLFDAVTWVRAYENYLNIVSTNHGIYGGSFAWTPKSKKDKELARLRGMNIFLIADIKLPVEKLVLEQRRGVQLARFHEMEKFLGRPKPEAEFKAPPPGYRPRK